MLYEYECDGCGCFTQSHPMGSAPQSVLCECGAPASRIYTMPALIVRGESKNGRNRAEYDPKHWATLPPKAADAGYSPAAYEKLHDESFNRNEAIAREVARHRRTSKSGDGGLRKIGEVSLAEMCAMQNETGEKVPSNETLLRKGRIYAHEAKNVRGKKAR